MELVYLLAIFSLAFLIKEMDGPYGILNTARSWLISRPGQIGVFFYKLLSCYYCLGFHCGWFVYLLSAETWSFQFLILWGLAGAGISLIMRMVLDRLAEPVKIEPPVIVEPPKKPGRKPKATS